MNIKVLIPTFCCLFIFSGSFAQQLAEAYNKSGSTSRDAVVKDTIKPKSAHFKGGPVAFQDYIIKNVRYPTADGKNNTPAEVIVEFVVEQDGSLSGVKVTKSPNDYLSAETERVIKQSPKWEPASINGIPGRIRYAMSVKFNTTDAK